MQICVKYQVFVVYVIGILVLWDVSNGVELVNKIKEFYGVQIQIVDGLMEVKFIYEGVCWFYYFEKFVFIMDIGGGSMEFIQVYNDRIEYFCSFNIGVLWVIQKFFLCDLLLFNDQVELMDWFESYVVVLD